MRQGERYAKNPQQSSIRRARAKHN